MYHGLPATAGFSHSIPKLARQAAAPLPARRLLNNPSVKIWQHPMKKLQFLVGQRGRRETMLIGGAWDPVDGADPAHSPGTLKATAIRTFLAATGVDLSTALHWCDCIAQLMSTVCFHVLGHIAMIDSRSGVCHLIHQALEEPLSVRVTQECMDSPIKCNYSPVHRAPMCGAA